MKKLLRFIAILLVFAAVIWWITTRKGEVPITRSPQPAAAATIGKPATERKPPPIATQKEWPPNPVDIAARQAGAAQERAQKLDTALDEWRTPIEFYGKVVDEAENPVAEAKVNFSCNDLSATGTSYYKAQSDEQGRFSIGGIKGKLLTARVSKEGFYSSKRDNDSFYYAGQNVNFAPDQNNPIVFHLRKKGAQKI